MDPNNDYERQIEAAEREKRAKERKEKWKKREDSFWKAFLFTEDGKPLELGVGKTYVNVIPKTADIVCE